MRIKQDTKIKSSQLFRQVNQLMLYKYIAFVDQKVSEMKRTPLSTLGCLTTLQIQSALR